MKHPNLSTYLAGLISLGLLPGLRPTRSFAQDVLPAYKRSLDDD